MNAMRKTADGLDVFVPAPAPSFYAPLIREVIAELQSRLLPPLVYDPADVEAWMRVGHSTLDGLDRMSFKTEVFFALACIDQVAPEETARLRASYGL